MKLLVTGVSGYIGGSVARKLSEAGHDVTGLARSEDAKALGINILKMDMNAYTALKPEIKKFDGVVNTADSDNAHFVANVLATYEGTGKLFLHTSGSSIVSDKAGGEYSERVYDESTIHPLLEKEARVAIDRAILKAHGIRGVVICPPMIYGRGKGIKKDSIQIPMLEKAAKARGNAFHIGRGENVWSNLHIDDLTTLFSLAVAKADAGSFFFAENGEASLKSIAQGINRKLGFATPPDSLSIDEAIAMWGPDAAQFAFAANSRISSTKARSVLGWNPQNSLSIGVLED